MDTLMRTLKVLSLGLLLLGKFAPEAAAQNWIAAQNWEDRGYFNISYGGQSQDQTFTDTSTFTIYGERGATAAGHTIGGGGLFDVSAGYKLWQNFGVGIGYSSNKNKNDATVSVRVPHPIVFGQHREASATATDLNHSENAVHLQLVWMMPVTSDIQLAFTVGPTFFTVRQDVATVLAPQDIRDVAPFTSVSISTVTVTEVKDSPVGFNVGVDGTYAIAEYEGFKIGAGAFVRYTGATLDLPVAPDTTRDEQPKAGGVQAGIGLRLRF